MKKYLIAAALTAAVVSPALAASHSRAYRGDDSANGAYAYAAPQADAVVVGGKVIGADPDVFIREQLLREGDRAELNGN
jgi:hypothetical protein